MSMSLYLIDKQIDELIRNNYDEETGEINPEIFTQLDELNMARDAKLEAIAIVYKNATAEAAALKEEKKVIAERQAKAEKLANKMHDYLFGALDGNPAPLSTKYSVSYRHTKSVDVFDEGACVAWCLMNNHDDCLKVTTEVKKTELGKLLKDDVQIDGAVISENLSMTIK